MKWFLAGMLAAAMLPAAEMEVASGRGVNIRKTPSTKSAVVGTLKSGDRVQVKQVKDGWAELGGRNGYVSASYLKPSANNPHGSGPQAAPQAVHHGSGPQAAPQAAHHGSGPQAAPQPAHHPGHHPAPHDPPAPRPHHPAPPAPVFTDLPVEPGSARDVTVTGLLYPIRSASTHVRYALLENVGGKYRVACYIYVPRPDGEKFKMFANQNVRLVGTWYKVPDWKKPVMKVRRIGNHTRP